MASFELRIVNTDRDSSTTVVTNRKLGPPIGGMCILILDIEASVTCELAPEDTPSLRAVLQELRDLKNKVFFGSITTLAVERYA